MDFAWISLGFEVARHDARHFRGLRQAGRPAGRRHLPHHQRLRRAVRHGAPGH